MGVFFANTGFSKIQIRCSVHIGMGVRSIMRVVIRNVFRAPACPLKLSSVASVLLLGQVVGAHGPSCLRVLRHVMRRAVCGAAAALARVGAAEMAAPAQREGLLAALQGLPPGLLAARGRMLESAGR